MNLSVDNLIDGTESILNDEERNLVPVIESVEHIAETDRVNRPAPVTRLDIRILDPIRQTAVDDIATVVRDDVTLHGRRHIITEAEIIDLSVL